jgi:hypothetical protein
MDFMLLNLYFSKQHFVEHWLSFFLLAIELSVLRKVASSYVFPLSAGKPNVNAENQSKSRYPVYFDDDTMED